MTKMPFEPAVFQSFSEKSDPSHVAPRLAALRAAMQKAGIDSFVIPRADAHRGESVPASEARLAYVTGFTGSAGMAVVGAKKAGLFVDSRYTLQAPAQTDTRKVSVHEVNHGGISADSLGSPRAVAIDADDNVYIADANNNRVLFYPAGSTTATRVYGQNGSFTTGITNNTPTYGLRIRSMLRTLPARSPTGIPMATEAA